MRRCTLVLVFVGVWSWFAGLAAGCSQPGGGLRILDDLEHHGLISDGGVDGEPRPTASIADDGVPADGPITLPILFDAADRLNPQMAAARARIGEAGGLAWQASLRPNPSVELESENVRPSGGGLGRSETTLSVRQPIVLGDRLGAATRAGEARVDAERWAFEETRREIHGRIRRLATEIEFDRVAITLYEELRTLSERTLDVADTRFEARAAPESESIRARVELNTLVLAIERLRGELAASATRLETLLGGHPVDARRVTVGAGRSEVREVPSLEDLAGLVRSDHPAVRAAAAAVEVAERNVELERARARPDLETRFGIGIDHADDEGFIEAGVGLPLPVYDRNQGNVLAARFGVIRAQREAAAVSSELLGQLGEAYRRLESATTRLGILETEVLVDAQRSYEQASVGYEAGKLPFLDLLDAQRTLAEATIAQSELCRSVSLAQADIEVILGRRLGPPIESEELP
ncbi:MAG: TolC family protein [Phycisphaerales bacterium]|nr:TolC family protein [Phycisphaerales bacterium]